MILEICRDLPLWIIRPPCGVASLVSVYPCRSYEGSCDTASSNKIDIAERLGGLCTRIIHHDGIYLVKRCHSIIRKRKMDALQRLISNAELLGVPFVKR